MNGIVPHLGAEEHEYTELNRRARYTQATEQIAGFERELFNHECNLERIDALPEHLRDEQWHAGREQVVKNIETLQSAINTTRGIADRLS